MILKTFLSNFSFNKVAHLCNKLLEFPSFNKSGFHFTVPFIFQSTSYNAYSKTKILVYSFLCFYNPSINLLFLHGFALQENFAGGYW